MPSLIRHFRHFAFLLAGLLAFSLPVNAEEAAVAARPLERADLEAWLDGMVPATLAKDDIAGAVITVVKDGQVLLQKGYGYSDVAKRTPVDPENTLFRPGSVSKLFTWTAVMQLIEAGKIDLDADINTYLDFKIPARADGPITMRHVMTHTAGFEERVKQLIVSDPKFMRPLGDYVSEYIPSRIFKAGTTPAYSNYATTLAGRIVERVSGESFDDYVEKHIFAPAGMHHATFRQPLPAALQPLMSQGYTVATEAPKPYEIIVPAPAGSLAASGADMARFMLAQLASRDGSSPALLSAAAAKQMHESRFAYGVGPLNRMLLGFYETNYNGRRVIAHGGDTQFFHSELHLILDEKVGMFISVNSAGSSRSRLRTDFYEGFMDRYFPAPSAAPVVAGVPEAVAKQHAQMAAGTYESSRRPDTSYLRVLSLIGPVKLTANADGSLTGGLITGANGKPRRYVEVSPFVWQDPVTRWRLAGIVENGQVTRFTIEEVSAIMVLDRYPASRDPAWLLPAVIVAVVATLGTVLLWPIAAWSRRRHGVQLPLQAAALRAHRISRWATLALVVPTVAWIIFILLAATGENLLNGSFDGVVVAIEVASILGYVGGTAALLWATTQAWSLGRPWVARLWTLALALSGLVLLWTAYTHHFMNFYLNY
jgi:CubicO group peptidase (beta-lactamase class C family)